MKVKHLKIDDARSLIAFILCVGILVGIPVYWFVLVPPALEIQEIHQGPFTATGYFAPGGYFNVQLNLDKDSIQGLHNGALFIAPHITNSQNVSLWQPTDTRVDQWPGTKSEIKYSSSDPINKRMFLTIDRINIPNSTELKGKTVPITIQYSVNYPVQIGLTEVLGGTITNFDVKTEVIERNLTIKLGNKVITSRDKEIIVANELWKKIVSLVVWIISLLIILLVFTTFKFVENFKRKCQDLFKRIVSVIRKLIERVV
jgi:hypothetical protein